LKVLVIPLCKKVKDKVKAHGKIWNAVKNVDGETHLETLVPVHKGGYPYSMWVVEGKHCKLERV